MLGNIKKIRDRFTQDPEKYKTLQDMVEAEVKLTSNKKERIGTEGLMWLRRGLQFTSLAIRTNLQDPMEEPSASFSKAYGDSLSQYHNMLIRPIFHLAMKATPARADFYKKLGGDDYQATVGKITPWLNALESQVQTLVEFYKKGGHEY
jgi:hypothetical protein